MASKEEGGLADLITATNESADSSISIVGGSAGADGVGGRLRWQFGPWHGCGFVGRSDSTSTDTFVVGIGIAV